MPWDNVIVRVLMHTQIIQKPEKLFTGSSSSSTWINDDEYNPLQSINTIEIFLYWTIR